MMRSRAACATLIGVFLLAGAALDASRARSAPPAAPLRPSLADLLRKMPPELLDRAGGAFPDAEGLVGSNRGGFKASAFQRGATLKLAVAAVRGDRARADDCWRAVDAAFDRQADAGHFDDPPTSVAFWLCELSRTLLVIRDSPLAPDFEERIRRTLPRLKKAADWLASESAQLERGDARAPNRLFFDAEAFAFSGILLDDAKLRDLGRRFLDRGMKLYRADDGVFLEHGGGDSSYQAANLLRLQEILACVPDERIAEAVARGVAWELDRIDPDGTVGTEENTRVKPGGEKLLGKEKQVNVGEVSLALLYYHARTGDRPALEAAERVQRRARARLGR